MTQQEPGRGFDPARLLNRRVVAWVAVAAIAVMALGLWVNDLVTPAHRVGVPTTTISRPAPTTPAPTAPAGSASPGATASPSTPAVTPQPTEDPTIPSSGEFTDSSVTVEPVASVGRRYSSVVAVETTTKLAVNPIAEQIARILNDPRSWAGSGRVRFALVADRENADFTVYLSSPGTAKTQCGGDAEAEWVCRSGGKLVINAVHWLIPARTYRSDAAGFQRYLVNHVIGHYLEAGHASCEKAGQPAPVMALQGDDLGGCTPNPWPNG